MDEKYKKILGGLWMVSIVLVSVWLLSLFKKTDDFQLATLLWAFSFLGGLYFKSYCIWNVQKDKGLNKEKLK